MKHLAYIFFLPLIFAANAYGARLEELSGDVGLWDQWQRLLAFQDPTVRLVMLGAVLIGVLNGIVGMFLVVRREALMGDVLSHAVFPGVIAGFAWAMEKNVAKMFIGALLTGLIARWLIAKVVAGTRLKEDCAMGLVLTGFYGLGIVLLTTVQKMAGGQQAGLDAFLFGQAAAMSEADITLLASLVLAVGLILLFAYKYLLLNAFDSVLARLMGPRIAIANALMSILTVAVIVASVKAVGVVLVSGLLVIPGTVGLLIANRMRKCLWISVLTGLCMSIIGVSISFLSYGLPTGPMIVLVGSLIFIGVFLFWPRKGWLWRRMRSNQVVH